MKQSQKPSIILWDLHEVLFRRHFSQWMWQCITDKRLIRVIGSLDMHVISLCFRYLLHVMHIKRCELSSQELIDYAQKNEKFILTEVTTSIGCTYKPISETLAIFNQLAAIGYQLDLGSNIGESVYEQFKEQFPEIFTKFTNHQLVYKNQEQVIKKPSPLFFTCYLEKTGYDPSDILFIDDKIHNIKAAQEVGIRGIHFQSALQLSQILKKEGVL